MKSLLCNKKVRLNLYKWLGMYVGVIALFTSVVTYSKYMSKLSSNDSARVASFEVKVNYEGAEGCDAADTDATCLVGKYRPTSEIPYYFSVDTRRLEVRTYFVLNINVANSFSIVKLERLIEGTGNLYEDVTYKNNQVRKIVEARKGDITWYKLTIKYNGGKIVRDGDNQPLYYDEAKAIEDLPDKIVTVGYSALQITADDVKEVTE